MEISHSKLAFSKKQALLKEYPGLKRHFAELENVIKESNPANTIFTAPFPCIARNAFFG